MANNNSKLIAIVITVIVVLLLFYFFFNCNISFGVGDRRRRGRRNDCSESDVSSVESEGDDCNDGCNSASDEESCEKPKFVKRKRSRKPIPMKYYYFGIPNIFGSSCRPSRNNRRRRGKRC